MQLNWWTYGPHTPPTKICSYIMTQNRAKYASEVIISKDPTSLNKDPSTLIGTKLETG